MSRLILLLFPLFISVCYSSQFANELFKYDNLALYPKRVVESILVPKRIDDVAYISFSAEHAANASKGGVQMPTKDHVGCNPIIAKVVLEGLAEVLWTASLETGTSKTRHTSLSLSPDGRMLYVGATLFNVNETEHKFQLLAINTENGTRAAKAVHVSTLAGSQIIHATTVDKSGIYICGRSTRAPLDKDANPETIQSWDLLLGKVSFTGRLTWRYTQNIGNKTCVDVQKHAGKVYTAGDANRTSVLYKHSSAGALLWARAVRSTLELPMSTRGMVVGENGVFLASYISSVGKSFVQKVSGTGTLLWSRESAEGYAVGMGYSEGFLYGIVSGAKGMTVARMDRFGEMLGWTDVDIPGASARWVRMSKAFLIVGKTKVLYGVGMTGGVVDDSTTGAEEYEIVLRISTSASPQAINEYLSDSTRGGIVDSTSANGVTKVRILIRADSAESSSRALFGRVRGAFVRGADGESALSRAAGTAVELRDSEVRGVATEGKRANVGVVVVGVVVGVGAVMAVVGTWFVASRWFASAGEHVAMG